MASYRQQHSSGTESARTFVKGVAYLLLLLCSEQLAPITTAGERLSFLQPLTVRWSYNSDETVNLTPAADSTNVYLPLSGGSLIALLVSMVFEGFQPDVRTALGAGLAVAGNALILRRRPPPPDVSSGLRTSAPLTSPATE